MGVQAVIPRRRCSRSTGVRQNGEKRSEAPRNVRVTTSLISGEQNRVCFGVARGCASNSRLGWVAGEASGPHSGVRFAGRSFGHPPGVCRGAPLMNSGLATLGYGTYNDHVVETGHVAREGHASLRSPRRERSHSWDVDLPARGPAPQSRNACSPVEAGRIRRPQSIPSRLPSVLCFASACAYAASSCSRSSSTIRAQTKPASSRATDVAATGVCLPLASIFQ